jgi:hypothetical protein
LSIAFLPVAIVLSGYSVDWRRLGSQEFLNVIEGRGFKLKNGKESPIVRFGLSLALNPY